MSSTSQQYAAAKQYSQKQMDYIQSNPYDLYRQPDGCCQGEMLAYWAVIIALLLLVILILLFWGIASSVDDGENN